MIRIVAGLAGIALSLSPMAVSAQTAPASTTNRLDPDQLVCRTMVITGSRLGARKICQTRAKWEAMARNDRKMIEEGVGRSFNFTCTTAMQDACGK